MGIVQTHWKKQVNNNDKRSSIINYNRQGRSKIDNWGGLIFIYLCSQTIKTIDFKRNQLCRTRIYEYQPPPIIELATALTTDTFDLILTRWSKIYFRLSASYIQLLKYLEFIVLAFYSV